MKNHENISVALTRPPVGRFRHNGVPAVDLPQKWFELFQLLTELLGQVTIFYVVLLTFGM